MKRICIAIAGLVFLTQVAYGAESAARKPRFKKYKMKLDVAGFDKREFFLALGKKLDISNVLNEQLKETLHQHADYIAHYSSRAELPFVDAASADVACLLDQPQFVLEGYLLGFEFVSRLGLNFGFRADLDFSDWKAASIAIDIKRSELDFQVAITRPFFSTVDAYARVQGHETSTYLSGRLNLAKLLDQEYEYWSKTPMAEVTSRALKKGLERLQKNLGARGWEAKVIAVRDSEIWVDAGALSGLEVGDRLHVHPTEHFWAEAPCESEYLGGIRDEARVTTIEIVRVGERVSQGVVTSTQPTKFSLMRAGDTVTAAPLSR